MKIKKDLIFATVAIAVLGVFIVLSQISRKPPPVTVGAAHEGMTRSTPRELCVGCHAPDSPVRPMSERHPKKGKPPDTMSCFACHQPPAKTNKTEGQISWRDQRLK
jgi:hypothetical protein